MTLGGQTVFVMKATVGAPSAAHQAGIASPTQTGPAAAPEASTPGWVGTNEAVRDLHRTIFQNTSEAALSVAELGSSQTDPNLRPPGPIPQSRSETTSLNPEYRLCPSVGTASDLAKPGGFRRAYIMPQLTEGSDHHSYAARPLVEHMESSGWTLGFITDVVQALPDGTELRFESRGYRLGRPPQIVRTPSGVLPRPPPLRFCGWRPYSVPYWVAVCFMSGAILFVFGSFCWMLPQVGDASRGAPPWEAAWTVAYPYMLGSVFFTAGCYLAWVEVLNANLQVDVRANPQGLNPAGSVHRQSQLDRELAVPTAGADAGGLKARLLDAPPMRRPFTSFGGCVRALRWWGWQPHSLLFWGALVQLWGALLFNLSCYGGLPGAALPLGGHDGEVWLVYLPSTVGSMCFVFASYIYVTEVNHDYHIFALPEAISLGYLVAMLNLIGSAAFLVASLFYFVASLDQALPGWGIDAGGLWGWEYESSEWGVRFMFGVGSFAFVASALLNFAEILSD